MLNFKELRKKKNLTQKEFSELINVSMRALSNYENGNTDITLKKLQEIADLLEINFFELFADNKENSIFLVEEPKPTYGKEEKTNFDLLIKNNSLLKEQNQLQEEVILMLKDKLQFTEEKLQQCEQDKNISQVTG